LSRDYQVCAVHIFSLAAKSLDCDLENDCFEVATLRRHLKIFERLTPVMHTQPGVIYAPEHERFAVVASAQNACDIDDVSDLILFTIFAAVSLHISCDDACGRIPHRTGGRARRKVK
jgi:hypothetical protein